MPRVQNLYRTAAEWTSANPVLAAGQTGVEKTTNKSKTGNGVATWTQLKYNSTLSVKTAVTTLDFPNVTAAGAQELPVTVTGAAVGDLVVLGAPAAIEAGLVWNGFVSAADTVKIRVTNVSGSGVNPASASWKVAVLS